MGLKFLESVYKCAGKSTIVTPITNKFDDKISDQFKIELDRRLVTKIYKRKGIIMFLIMFGIFWIFMFLFQFREPKRHRKNIDMKEYAFCSNVIVSFPKWLIFLLFFNIRLTRLPFTIVCGQIINYVFGILCCIRYLVLGNSIDLGYPISKVVESWFIVFVGLLIVMIIDHEIYCFKHRNDFHI